jgi:predicted rRNA methylase YqxC with S4 and FtsJ domains
VEGVLKAFGIDPKERSWTWELDGRIYGLCLSEEPKVYAVDVGYGQLAWELRKDLEYQSSEQHSISSRRRLRKDGVDLILIDASFISIEKFLPSFSDS